MDAVLALSVGVIGGLVVGFTGGFEAAKLRFKEPRGKGRQGQTIFRERPVQPRPDGPRVVKALIRPTAEERNAARPWEGLED